MRIKQRHKLVCPACGSSNIHSEVVQRSEWAANREVTKSVTVHYCAEANCGHSWE